MHNTYDIFIGSMLVGLHLYLPSSNVAPFGSFESKLTATVSPSKSKVVTISTFSRPTVTLNVLSTVILGLALAAKIALY